MQALSALDGLFASLGVGASSGKAAAAATELGLLFAAALSSAPRGATPLGRPEESGLASPDQGEPKSDAPANSSSEAAGLAMLAFLLAAPSTGPVPTTTGPAGPEATRAGQSGEAAATAPPSPLATPPLASAQALTTSPSAAAGPPSPAETAPAEGAGPAPAAAFPPGLPPASDQATPAEMPKPAAPAASPELVRPDQAVPTIAPAGEVAAFIRPPSGSGPASEPDQGWGRADQSGKVRPKGNTRSDLAGLPTIGAEGDLLAAAGRLGFAPTVAPGAGDSQRTPRRPDDGRGDVVTATALQSKASSPPAASEAVIPQPAASAEVGSVPGPATASGTIALPPSASVVPPSGEIVQPRSGVQPTAGEIRQSPDQLPAQGPDQSVRAGGGLLPGPERGLSATPRSVRGSSRATGTADLSGARVMTGGDTAGTGVGDEGVRVAAVSGAAGGSEAAGPAGEPGAAVPLGAQGAAPGGTAAPGDGPPASRAPLAEQLASGVRRALDSPGHRVRLRLEPRGLGTVELRVSLGENGGGLRVTISVDQTTTRDLVQGGWSDLNRVLEQRGIGIEQLQLELTSGFGGGPGAERQPPPTPARPARRADLAAPAEPAAESAVGPEGGREASRQIDYRI